MEYELSKHARFNLVDRKSSAEWLERTLEFPEFVLQHETDPTLESRFARIAEKDSRVLRVVVNVAVSPERVVTVYFDRTMRTRL